MFGIGVPELIIIALAFGLLFFGSKKVTEFANSLGRFSGEFKKGKQNIERELKAGEEWVEQIKQTEVEKVGKPGKVEKNENVETVGHVEHVEYVEYFEKAEKKNESETESGAKSRRVV